MKHNGKDSILYSGIVKFGQKCNEFEVILNRRLVRGKGLSIVPDLAESVAFNKGVEWLVELVFFYGLLFGLAFYEINKAEHAKKKLTQTLKDLENLT